MTRKFNLARSQWLWPLVVAGLLSACTPTAPAAPPATSAPAPASKPAVPAAAPTSATAGAGAAPTGVAPAAKAPTTPEEIYTYTGADRQQMLEDGAKQEGHLLWYTTEILNERAVPMANGFMQKYPFIKVDIVQLDTGPLMQRAVEEYKANKFDLDVVEGSYPIMLTLKGQKMLAKYTSPSLSGMPDGVKDPDGYFVGDRETPLGFAWNTKQVPESDGPKTYDELLTPKWKGKLSTNDSVQGVQFFGALLKIKGEDYVRKLAQQDITVYAGVTSKAAGDLVVAGEAVSTFPNSVGQIADSRKSGAPIAWTGLEQAPTLFGNMALLMKAPHPHAAMLFADWTLSDEGQKIMATTGEGATRKGIESAFGGYKYTPFYVESSFPQDQYQAELKKWQDLFNQLILKRPA